MEEKPRSSHLKKTKGCFESDKQGLIKIRRVMEKGGNNTWSGNVLLESLQSYESLLSCDLEAFTTTGGIGEPSSV